MTDWVVYVLDGDEAIVGSVPCTDRDSAIEAIKVLSEYEDIESRDRFVELRCEDEQ